MRELSEDMASKLYGVDATIIIFVFVLYCIVLYCIVLYCIVLYCIVLYCIVLYCIVLYLYCIVKNDQKMGVIAYEREVVESYVKNSGLYWETKGP